MPNLFSQMCIDLFPGSVFAPFVIVVENAVIVRIFMRLVFPLTPRPHDVENRIHDLTQIQFKRTPGSLPLRTQKWLENFPLLIRQVTGIKFLFVRQ